MALYITKNKHLSSHIFINSSNSRLVPFPSVALLAKVGFSCCLKGLILGLRGVRGKEPARRGVSSSTATLGVVPLDLWPFKLHWLKDGIVSGLESILVIPSHADCGRNAGDFASGGGDSSGCRY